MSGESDFISALRAFATDPAARGLLDDAAVLRIGGANLVLTHDMIVEGVHFLHGDDPADVAWKLLAVNLSDLAAKGARPSGVLLGYPLAGDSAWDRAFLDGLGAALGAFDVPLLGGDTVTAASNAPRSLGLTAVGLTDGPVPSRTGAREGDLLWVTGTIGDAGLGLRIAQGHMSGPDALVRRYHVPAPRLEAGRKLAPRVSAMMDVSDGLLIDASRLAGASGLAVILELDRIPLSPSLIQCVGTGPEARMAAATAGDDYELLFAADAAQTEDLLALADALDLPFSRIGRFASGAGMILHEVGRPIPLPDRLGFEHSAP